MMAMVNWNLPRGRTNEQPPPEVAFPIHRGLLVWEGLDPPHPSRLRRATLSRGRLPPGGGWSVGPEKE